MSSSNCYFLICIQVSQEAGKVVWYSHLLKNCLQFVVIHTIKGFGVVNKAVVDGFSETLLLFTISLVSSGYLRLLIFLLEILIPAWASSIPAFHMMCSACKLSKQGDNIESWHTPFLILKQSMFHVWSLTVASWPAYKSLRRQVRWSGIPICWRIFLSLLWSTQSKALV